MYVFRLRSVVIFCLAAGLLISGITGFFTGTGQPVDATVEEGICLPVVMYHHVLETGKFGEYVISSRELEEDLKYIAEQGYEGVLMRDLIAYVKEGTPLPEKPILLTFDDGYESNYRYAFPLLQKYGMKAVISVIGYWSEIYSQEQYKHINYSHLTWEQLRELEESGIVEIQNHSYNLHSLEKRKGARIQKGEDVAHYTEILRQDLSKNQELLQNATGVLPTTFTYPFGYISKESFEVLKELGFQASLSCQEGMNRITHDPECLFLLKRYNRPHGVDTRAFLDRVFQGK